MTKKTWSEHMVLMEKAGELAWEEALTNGKNRNAANLAASHAERQYRLDNSFSGHRDSQGTQLQHDKRIR